MCDLAIPLKRAEANCTCGLSHDQTGGESMKSQQENARATAIIQTVSVCVLAELLAVFTLKAFTSHWLEAFAMSILFLGPVSVWLAPPLYRYLLDAIA